MNTLLIQISCVLNCFEKSRIPFCYSILVIIYVVRKIPGVKVTSAYITIMGQLNSKRKKESKTKSNSSLKLTDLDNHYCLVGILSNLDVNNLLTVAHTSKQMRTAAKFALKRKFKSHQYLCLTFNSAAKKNNIYVYQGSPNNGVLSGNLRFSLQVIRCFGDIITEVTDHIHHEVNDKIVEMRLIKTSYLFSYVNEYLFNSLKKLTIDNRSNLFNIFSGAKNQFINIEEISAHNWTLSKEHFKWLFPRLQHFCYESDDFSCIEENFSEMKSIKLKALYLDWPHLNYTHLHESISKCFRLNPQLIELSITFSYVPIEMVRSASELLPSLKSLEVETLLFWPNVTPIHFKNVDKFKCSYRNTIPFKFDKLEEFEFRYSCDIYDNDSNGVMIEFLTKHKSIVKLSVANKAFLLLTNLSEILPSLRELSITDYGLMWFDIVDFLNRQHSFDTTDFCLADDCDWNALCVNNWRIKCQTYKRNSRMTHIVMEQKS